MTPKGIKGYVRYPLGLAIKDRVPESKVPVISEKVTKKNLKIPLFLTLLNKGRVNFLSLLTKFQIQLKQTIYKVL